MANRRFFLLVGVSLAVPTALALSLRAAKAAPVAEVIFSFGDEGGEYPATDLVMDAAGNLYGTTVTGGDWGSGTVFQLTRSDGSWTENVLYSFTSGADGAQPYGGVTLDAQGALYGATVTGGTGMACEGGCGVVYKLSRTGNGWSQDVLYNFTGGEDGSGPGAGLTFDGAGNLYGMTPTGGAFGLGVIYQLSPGPNAAWAQSVVHTFTGGKDGATGSAGRLLLDGGNLYGVATVGGAHGKGTAFRLSPGPGGRWKFKTLHAFKGSPGAGLPYGALIRDAAGNLYGTTYYDGAYGYGTAYRLSPGSGDEWRERVLYSFRNGSFGGYPIGHLNLDASGNLYGTTSEGGFPGCSCGTIFKLTPAGDGWQTSVVHQFRGAPDGKYAYNGMVAGPGGTFYGSTVHGGAEDDGVVYEFKP
jgi:uncharacterized repeat protein (TIGR03803 family)